MELMRDLEGQTHRRAASLDGVAISGEERTMEFSFSSEFPVQRYFGNEVLSHDRSAVDLSRLEDGAPLLFNHDPAKVIGVVERAWLDGEKKRGMVSVKFSRNSFAQEVMTDVADGVLRNISVGYSINSLEERGDNFVATSWSPYEVSVVGIPADPTIGIRRTLETDGAAPAAKPTPDPSPLTMEDTTLNIEAVRAEAAAKAANAERTRIATINALTERHGLSDLGATLIENGRSIDEARAAVLDKLSAKPIETVKSVEMGQRDAGRFSITAGIRAALTGDWSSYEAGLVREMSAEVQKSMGRAPSAERAFFIPFSALTRATYVTSGATTGGNLVQTDLLDQDFIEFLRNRSVMLAAGVRTMPGLQGNVAIPRRSGVASTYYLSSQTTAITQSESTFDQVTLSPKNLAALSKYSRQTLLQSTPGIEQLVRTDLIDGINVAMDLGILNGTGSSQPTGIMQTSGIGSVAIGTNGGAITMDTLVNLETELTIDNVPVDRNTVSYITNAKVMGNLKKLRAGGSTSTDGPFLVNDNLLAIGRGATPSVVNGYPIYVTNQVPSTLTKGTSSGVCSAVLLGDFSQAMVGLWGNGLEITLGEDADDFSKALTSVRGIVTYDVAVRDPKCFAAVLDVTTT